MRVESHGVRGSTVSRQAPVRPEILSQSSPANRMTPSACVNRGSTIVPRLTGERRSGATKLPALTELRRARTACPCREADLACSARAVSAEKPVARLGSRRLALRLTVGDLWSATAPREWPWTGSTRRVRTMTVRTIAVRLTEYVWPMGERGLLRCATFVLMVERGPRGADRHVTAPVLGASPERKSARTSSRHEPIGLRRQAQPHQHVRGFQEAPVSFTSTSEQRDNVFAPYRRGL
jgi:hypothetical protein